MFCLSWRSLRGFHLTFPTLILWIETQIWKVWWMSSMSGAASPQEGSQWPLPLAVHVLCSPFQELTNKISHKWHCVISAASHKGDCSFRVCSLGSPPPHQGEASCYVMSTRRVQWKGSHREELKRCPSSQTPRQPCKWVTLTWMPQSHSCPKSLQPQLTSDWTSWEPLSQNCPAKLHPNSCLKKLGRDTCLFLF